MSIDNATSAEIWGAERKYNKRLDSRLPTPKQEQNVVNNNEEKAKALDEQIGGDHYKQYPIQPMVYSMANELNACQHTAIKYITRYKNKHGKQDLEKAIHTIQLLMEIEYV